MPDPVLLLIVNGEASVRLWFQTGNTTYLEKAADHFREARRTVTPRHPRASDAYRLLRGTLRYLYEQKGDLAALVEGIQIGREAVRIGLPNRMRHLDSLGLLLQMLFEQNSDRALLEEAIEVGRRALELAGNMNERGSCAGSLGVAFLVRYDTASDPADLDTAISLFRQSVEVRDGSREIPLSQLQLALMRRYELLGRQADLKESLDAGEAAIACEQKNGLDRARTLIGLVGAMREQFRLTNDLAILDLAITRSRLGVTLLPPRYPNRLRHEATLATLLGSRFQTTGDVDSLREAIKLTRPAAYAPAGYIGPGLHKARLAVMLCDLAEATGDRAGLDEAIGVAVDAVRSTAQGHPDYVTVVSTYASALIARCEQHRDPESGRKAMAMLYDLLTLPGTGLARWSLLVNLCAASTHLAEAASDPSVMDDPARLLREALNTGEPDPAVTAAGQANLAAMELARARLTSDPQAVQAALAQLQVSTADPMLPTRARLTGAVHGHNLAAGAGDWGAAARLGRAAIGLLPMLARPYLSRLTQELSLVQLSGIGSDTAAAILHTAPSTPAEAFGLLEHGRAVIAGRILDMRQDLREVRAVDPELAERFDQLSRLLDQPADRDVASEARDRRHETVRQWDAVVAEIRARGLPRFLQPLQVSDLLPAAGDGTVVTVNVSRHRCDAFLLRGDGVSVLPLPELTVAAVEEAVKRWSRRQDLDGILRWLWTVVAEPVLDALGHTEQIGDDAGGPRVWWSPTGALSRLPLHAAGIHGTGKAVLDRVVSSYTPTVRALLEARRRPVQQRSIMVAAMRHTPGMPDLPGAAVEADMIQRLFPDATVITDRQATRESVLEQLAESSWAHFICHTAHTGQNYLTGCLRMWDGEITAADIFHRRVAGGELAVLASCATAANHDGLLADEALHLVAAFGLAGYQHVIGALWPVVDWVTAGQTAELYTMLKKDGVCDLAGTMHRLARRLRDEHPDRPETWTPYIHFGP